VHIRNFWPSIFISVGSTPKGVPKISRAVDRAFRFPHPEGMPDSSRPVISPLINPVENGTGLINITELHESTIHLYPRMNVSTIHSSQADLLTSFHVPDARLGA
jgi:hypothetical protein